MKFLSHRADAAARHWTALVVRGAAACAIAAGLALSADTGSGRPPGANNNTAAGGDETIGTLPVTGRNGIQLPFARNWRGTQPAIYVEGNGSELASAILGARGRGYVTVELLDPASQRVRLAFHGDVIAILDRDIVSNSSIELGVAVPGSFGPARTTMAYGDGVQRGLRVQPGVLHLPVSAMSQQGLLDSNPLQVWMQGSGPHASQHTIGATPDLLILRQVD